MLDEGLLLIGTGVSSAVPELHHILPLGKTAWTHPVPDSGVKDYSEIWDEVELFKESGTRGVGVCNTCVSALRDPTSPNRRGNVCAALLKNGAEVDAEGQRQRKVILVDVGKTFREAALHLFPKHDITRVDAILVTHGHQDALGGFDELRNLQIFERPFSTDPSMSHTRLFQPTRRLPVYLTRPTMRVVEQSFDYIVEASKETGPLHRKVACADFHILPEFDIEKVSTSGVDVVSLPVFHGGEYVSLGFAFGPRQEVIYISDVSKIPENIERFISASPQPQLLVIDGLVYSSKNYSHNSVLDSLRYVKMWQPKRVCFVGMCCDIDYYDGCSRLKQWLRIAKREDPTFATEVVEMGRDGLFVPIKFNEVVKGGK